MASFDASVRRPLGSLLASFDLDTLPRRRALLVWLSERQFEGDQGGTNGRPGKRADVCYAWWVGASLAVLGDVDTAIDRGKLGLLSLLFPTPQTPTLEVTEGCMGDWMCLLGTC